MKVAKKRGLDGIAVTDHNEMRGALKAKKCNKDKDFEVVVGSEIKTNKGDVLAYYINEPIKSRNLFEVLDEIKQQGSLAVVAHPFRILMPHLRFRYPLKEIRNKINGIECLNLRSSFLANKQANNVCSKLKLAKTAGSDAHFSFELGRAATVFEGDLRKAILKRKTKVEEMRKFGKPVGPFGAALSSFLRGKRKIWAKGYRKRLGK
jgi:predicted metal-dependent phosphoesterase TrpH